MILDETHDPEAASWVESAHGHPDFPIQNLPLGIFSTTDRAARGGMAIGDMIVDLAMAARSGLLPDDAQRAAEAASGPTLNPLLALGTGPRRALRRALFALLSQDTEHDKVETWLVPAEDCRLHLPAAIGDYTDFYAGIHHALNVGRRFRPADPLLPNYKYVPIGYHGRASTVRPSGIDVRRPRGQYRPIESDAPLYAPSDRLDIELELGVWIGPGNPDGTPIAIANASSHIAGLCLLNDWSARDIQTWEYQPLGPFLAKSFATTVSPWIVTAEALAPFRIPQPRRPEGDPAPLPYLSDTEDQATGAFALEFEILLQTTAMMTHKRPPVRISHTEASHLYWTVAQMVAHHSSNGCVLNPGDLLGTGTISGPTPGSYGSLLELAEGGMRPILLPSGETRGFLEDGDVLTLTGRACAAGYADIGFGPCTAMILPA